MIVVLGPVDLAEAVAASLPGELVVGGGDDDRLAGPPTVAVPAAAELPLPIATCVVAASSHALTAAAATQRAGGPFESTRVIVVGPPPEGAAVGWRRAVERRGATALDRLEDMVAMLAAESPAIRRGPGRSARPGAPEVAVWRDALRSGGGRRLALLPAGRRRHEHLLSEGGLDAVVARQVDRGCHRIAVISPKGGVGKTLLSFLLGSVLAQVRGGRVLVVDTNPDFGTLADLVEERVAATISDLLADRASVETAEDVERYVTVTETGMHILAAPQDPMEMGRLGRGGYLAVNDLIARFYDLVVFDCGTGFLDEVTQFALGAADQVVLVSAPLLVTTKIILSAVDHLAASSFDLARATLALNMIRRGDPLDRARLRRHLQGRIGGVVEIPYDERVQRDLDLGQFRYARLGGTTRVAVKRLAAEVIGRLPDPQGPEQLTLVGTTVAAR